MRTARSAATKRHVIELGVSPKQKERARHGSGGQHLQDDLSGSTSRYGGASLAEGRLHETKEAANRGGLTRPGPSPTRALYDGPFRVDGARVSRHRPESQSLGSSRSRQAAYWGGLASSAYKAGLRDRKYEADSGHGEEGAKIPDAIHAEPTRACRHGSGGRRALRPSGGLGRGWTESRAPDPRRMTMLGTCHDSRVKLSAPLSGDQATNEMKTPPAWNEAQAAAFQPREGLAKSRILISPNGWREGSTAQRDQAQMDAWRRCVELGIEIPQPNRYGQETRSFHTRRGGLGHFFSVVLWMASLRVFPGGIVGWQRGWLGRLHRNPFAKASPGSWQRSRQLRRP